MTSCASLYFDESLMIGEQYDIASVSRPFEIRIDLNSVDGNNITHRISNGDLGGATGTFTVTRSGGTAGKFTVELDIRGLGSYHFKPVTPACASPFAAATKANEYGYAGLAQEEIGSVIIDQRNAAKHSVWITCDRGVTDIEDFDNNWVSEFVRLEYSPVHPTIGNSVYDGTLIGFSQDDAAAIVFEDNTMEQHERGDRRAGQHLREARREPVARTGRDRVPGHEEHRSRDAGAPVFGGYYKGKVTVVKVNRTNMERIKNLLRASALRFARCWAPRHAATTTERLARRRGASAPSFDGKEYPIHQGLLRAERGSVSFVFSPLVKSDGQLTTYFYFALADVFYRERGVARPPLPQRRLHLRLRGSVPLLFALPQAEGRYGLRVEPGGRSLSGEARHHAARRQVVLLRFRRPAGDLKR